VATRLYGIPSSSVGSLTPTADAGWELTTGFIRRILLPEVETLYGRTLIETKGTAETNASTTYDVLLVQFITGPLASGYSFSGSDTLKGQMLAVESNAAADHRAQLIAKVISNDGTSVVGTLLSMDGGALSSEFDVAPAENRQFPRGGAQALSSVSASAGDRILIEVGYRSHNNVTTSRTSTVTISQDTTDGDLGENETDLETTKASWFEFSSTLAFETEAQVTSHVVEMSAFETGRQVYTTSHVVETATFPAAGDVEPYLYWGVDVTPI
jgi:hypothetical protein